MKKIYLIMALACLVMVSCKKDGGDGKIQGHEYVDLGLPSGIKWATRNLGADNPEDYGHYFAWGETEPKNEYTEENSLTYDVVMTDISGNAQYDAATANWGDKWRMPTIEAFEELIEECDWIYEGVNGVNGYKVVGPNGNSIFLPLSGYRNGSSLKEAGVEGYYWSSAPDDDIYDPYYYCYVDIAKCLSLFGGLGCDMDNYPRYEGYSIRPIYGGEVIVNTPSIGSTSISNRTKTSVTLACNVSFDGGAKVTSRGVCWSTSQNPTINNNYKECGSGTGNFEITIDDLTEFTTYYIRGYATNSKGTNYGSEITVTTLSTPGEKVDLGLASGVKWATFNVGAKSPEEFGSCFHWASDTPDYSPVEEHGSYPPNDISGNEQYDAARIYWGETWRIPTADEIEELCYGCTWEWEILNGVSGAKVTGPNGNYIFLPNVDGCYWSSCSFDDYAAYCLVMGISDDGFYHSNYYWQKYSCNNIRPVSD